jgi:predicted protein tyrosine phosphatase
MTNYLSRQSFSNWLKLLPLAVALRLAVPAYRFVTGHPTRRFSAVLPQLWVGGQQYRRGVEDMRKAGITAVLNLRTQPDDFAMNRLMQSVHYLWLPTIDNTPPTLDDIRRGVDFIQQQIDAGGKVYVHCRAGVGRAPTMTACYLVSTGLTPDDAWAAIRKRRPFIYPTTLQIAQVDAYFRSLNLAVSIDAAPSDVNDPLS